MICDRQKTKLFVHVLMNSVTMYITECNLKNNRKIGLIKYTQKSYKKRNCSEQFVYRFPHLSHVDCFHTKTDILLSFTRYNVFNMYISPPSPPEYLSTFHTIIDLPPQLGRNFCNPLFTACHQGCLNPSSCHCFYCTSECYELKSTREL